MDCYAGIHVSFDLSDVCILNASGQFVREAKLASEPESLATFEDLAQVHLQLASEPGVRWHHKRDSLTSIVGQVGEVATSVQGSLALTMQMGRPLSHMTHHSPNRLPCDILERALKILSADCNFNFDGTALASVESKRSGRSCCPVFNLSTDEQCGCLQGVNSQSLLLIRYFEQMNSVICDFHPDNFPADLHGLAFYGDGASSRIEAYGLTPDDGSAAVAAAVWTIQETATSFGVPPTQVAAELVAAARRCQAPGVAAAFAQAIHLLTGNRFFVIHRYSDTDWRDATYHALPFLSSVEEAYAWLEHRISQVKEGAAQ
jgi:hypothetical protein